jgi:hypothetical protein
LRAASKVTLSSADKVNEEQPRVRHMRVDESSLTDQLSSTASRAAESQRIQVDTGAPPAAPAPWRGSRGPLRPRRPDFANHADPGQPDRATCRPVAEGRSRRAATSRTRSRSPAPWRGPENMPEPDLQELLAAARVACTRRAGFAAPAAYVQSGRMRHVCSARRRVIWSGCATAFPGPGRPTLGCATRQPFWPARSARPASCSNRPRVGPPLAGAPALREPRIHGIRQAARRWNSAGASLS